MASAKGSSAFEEAAADLGIAVAALKLWLLEQHGEEINSSRWSQFKHGHERIPDKWIREYLRERRAQDLDDEALLADLAIHSAQALRRAPLDKGEKRQRTDHLKRVITIFFSHPANADFLLATPKPRATSAPFAPISEAEIAPAPPAPRSARRGRLRPDSEEASH